MLGFQSISEMNHAVPGSLMSPPMETSLECAVPSPSQWSDPRSPLSLHSPPHYSDLDTKLKEEHPFQQAFSSTFSPPHQFTDLDKIKEEQISPFSPCSFYATLDSSPSPLYSSFSISLPLMSKDEGESSINLSAVVAENQALVQRVVQQQQREGLQYPPHQQAVAESAPPPSALSSSSVPTTQEEDSLGHFAFLDSLVDVKKEVEESSPALTQPQSVGHPISGVAQISSIISDISSTGVLCSSSSGTPIAATSGADFFKTVEIMALDYYRESVQRDSEILNIPKDPMKWIPANVRSWISFQCTKLQNVPQPRLDHWQMSGLELMSLSENQFKCLIPIGGDSLHAQLEIWRSVSQESSFPQESSSPSLLSHTLFQRSTEQQQPILQQRSPPTTVTPVTTVQQPVFCTSSETQIYHQPTTSAPAPQVLTSLLTASSKLLSPSAPPLQPSQSPSSTITHPQSQQHHLSIHMTSAQLPTVVVQAGVEKNDAAPKSTSRTPVGTIKQEKDFLQTSSFLEGEDVKPRTPADTGTTAQTTIEGHLDVQESEAEGEEEPAVPSTSTGRTGTHIHLWQFLKELLQQPHHYGSCIRWLDRSKGVFKIEDSVRVARLWGKRKNRPAMNYDKLSRSIRQYYKKGIMKKTERSQRLVYQFCSPYSL